MRLGGQGVVVRACCDIEAQALFAAQTCCGCNDACFLELAVACASWQTAVSIAAGPKCRVLEARHHRISCSALSMRPGCRGDVVRVWLRVTSAGILCSADMLWVLAHLLP
jgi:hypothetical protein